MFDRAVCALMSSGEPLADIAALEELCDVLAAQQQRIESENVEEKLTVGGPSALHESTDPASTRLTAKRRNHPNTSGAAPAPGKRGRRAPRRRGRS